MDVASTATALIIAFTGATGNMNNHVRDAVHDVMRQTPSVMLVSGSAQTKLRVDGLTVPFLSADMSAIAAKISEKTGCTFNGFTPVRQSNTQGIDFTCPRR